MKVIHVESTGVISIVRALLKHNELELAQELWKDVGHEFPDFGLNKSEISEQDPDKPEGHLKGTGEYRWSLVQYM
jgi:hypothetical protein